MMESIGLPLLPVFPPYIYNKKDINMWRYYGGNADHGDKLKSLCFHEKLQFTIALYSAHTIEDCYTCTPSAAAADREGLKSSRLLIDHPCFPRS